MIIISDHAEKKLLERLEAIRDERKKWRAHLYQLSALKGKLSLTDASRAARNLLHTQLEGAEGSLFFLFDGDILVLYKNESASKLEELKEQMCYLFSDYLIELPIDMFATVVDLETGFARLHNLAQEKQKTKKQLEHEARIQAASDKVDGLLGGVDQQQLVRALMQRMKREHLSVLIVDDDPLSLRMTRNVLQEDYHVLTAKDGKEGYELYLLHAPDVVFLDIDLPDFKGHDVLDRLLRIDEHAYVIMLSGNSYKAEILKAMQMGAKGFVGKPFAREKLIRYIEASPSNRKQEVA